jgi:hypothetical protein
MISMNPINSNSYAVQPWRHLLDIIEQSARRVDSSMIPRIPYLGEEMLGFLHNWTKLYTTRIRLVDQNGPNTRPRTLVTLARGRGRGDEVGPA